MHRRTKVARFALSSSGVAGAMVAAPAISEEIVITMHLDYWAGEHSMHLAGVCGGISSYVGTDGYLQAVSSGTAVITGTSFEPWNSAVSPYTSGYRWTIQADLEGGLYDVMLADAYGDGWAWNNVTGSDAFSVHGPCTYGETIIAFSSGNSASGTVLHCLGIVGCGGSDCNGNGIYDAYEIAEGLVADCNDNLAPDSCDISSGIEQDDNENEVPDGCELARGDLDLDGCVGPADLGFLLALWGASEPPTGDLDGDGTIGPTDLGVMLANWGCDG